MNVLVATTQTQGQRKNDFCFVPEGQLVRFAFECDGERVDGSCGCRRSMVGVSCHTGTTTMRVEDRDISPEEVTAIIRQSLVDTGLGVLSEKGELDQMAAGDAQELMRLAAAFHAGAIVEKRGAELRTRLPR